MNYIYALVNNLNPNPDNKDIDGGLECSGYIRHLLPKN